ncbi:MAG: GIY-YIG nuclease family protein [Candidatus Marinimicrobia bacterium]|nr:GIY-YIG nuclease family protein [Candidatus Neomarinimicrobiota bacterium]
MRIDNKLLDKSNLTQPGTYLLILENRKKITLSVGALGEISFPKGYYIYVGSAFGPGGLRGRLRHHISPVKQPRWHVDYLRPQMTLSEIWYTNDIKKREHDWAKALSSMPGTSIPKRGFGSSDCRCETHLFHYNEMPGDVLNSYISNTNSYERIKTIYRFI